MKKITLKFLFLIINNIFFLIINIFSQNLFITEFENNYYLTLNSYNIKIQKKIKYYIKNENNIFFISKITKNLNKKNLKIKYTIKLTKKLELVILNSIKRAIKKQNTITFIKIKGKGRIFLKKEGKNIFIGTEKIKGNIILYKKNIFFFNLKKIDKFYIYFYDKILSNIVNLKLKTDIYNSF